ncbi:MAG TPA: portal protein [Syntrophothermus lipocalidus]|nr:portal protein [Syntrophothermus lipocalidus]
MDYSLIVDSLVVFTAALLGGLAADRAKQSAVIGYIVAGIIIGPFVLGLVSDTHVIEAFAEIGVILLMFTLGIEFSFARLENVRPVALWGGICQIMALVVLGSIAGYVLGFSLPQALLLGCSVAISSTMLVMKVLESQGELNSLHGNIMLGILIIQDLVVVVMVTLLPWFSRLSLSSLPSLGFTLLKSILFVVAVVYVAQKIFPLVMKRAALTNDRDTFLLVALTFGIGVAVLGYFFGLSLSLGAFLAGLVISESEFTHEIIGKVSSLRNAFVILFFVSVGMLVNPICMVNNWPSLIMLLLLIVPLKFLVFFVIIRLFKYHSRVAFYVATGMIQTGEFSFVLAKLGLDYEIIPDSLYNLILASSIITMLFTPYLIEQAPRWYNWLRTKRCFAGLFPEPDIGDSAIDPTQLQGHIILCGYGRVGKSIGNALEKLQLPLVCVDFNYLAIQELTAKGIPCLYGDASSESVLVHTRPDTALLAIAALPDLASNVQVVHNLLKINPSLTVFARAHSRYEAEVLREAGALEVVEPEVEAGMETARLVILHLDVPREEVEQYLHSLYSRRVTITVQKRVYDSIRESRLKLREYLIDEKSPLAGKQLLDSSIRESTGCTVVTIKKANGELLLNPSGKEIIDAGDHLVVLGTSGQLALFSKFFIV